MEKNHNILQTLVDNIKQLPGIGPKAAQRIAFYLSISNKKLANELRLSLESALKEINLCEECNNFSFNLICDVCNLSNRDSKKLCIVEMPSDLQNIENTNFYNGKYYILMGRLSPINGIGPEQLKIEKLKKNIEEKEFDEIIIATNFNSDSDLTAEFLYTLLKGRAKSVTRLSRGISLGSEIDKVDVGTIAYAIQERSPFKI